MGVLSSPSTAHSFFALSSSFFSQQTREREREREKRGVSAMRRRDADKTRVATKEKERKRGDYIHVRDFGARSNRTAPPELWRKYSENSVGFRSALINRKAVITFDTSVRLCLDTAYRRKQQSSGETTSRSELTATSSAWYRYKKKRSSRIWRD